jgi:hypothetical protein
VSVYRINDDLVSTLRFAQVDHGACSLAHARHHALLGAPVAAAKWYYFTVSSVGVAYAPAEWP